MTTTLSSKALNQLAVAVADNTTNDEVRDLLDGSKVAHRPIITVTDATKTLTAAQSGSLVVLDKNDGIVVTLTEANADNVGWYCDFLIKTTAASAGFSIDGSRSADLYYGHVFISQDNTGTAGVKAIQLPNQSSHYKLAITGATKGWVQGGYVRVEIAAANMLVASGTLAGVGTSASPFA